MFEFFTETYREYVLGEDVETEKIIKKEEAKASRIIYPKDIKTITYVMGGLYLVSSMMSIAVTLKYKGFDLSVFFTLFLMIVDISTMYFLSRKTKRGEIIAIVLTIFFIASLYGTTMISMTLRG